MKPKEEEAQFNDKELRAVEFESYREFPKAAVEAWRMIKNGVKNVIFPHGAYLPSL